MRYLWKTRWVDKSTYVGERGLMIVSKRGKKLEVKRVLFEDVSDFEHYEYWYFGRSFLASWDDDHEGHERFVIKGYYLFENPATGHDYHFYKKAVDAWLSFEV